MVSMPAAADVGPPMGTSVVWGFSQAGGAIRPSVCVSGHCTGMLREAGPLSGCCVYYPGREDCVY